MRLPTFQLNGCHVHTCDTFSGAGRGIGSNLPWDLLSSRGILKLKEGGLPGDFIMLICV